MIGGNAGGGKPLRVWIVPLILLAVSYAAAIIAYPYLPEQIPIHWGTGGTQYAGKAFIFLIALLPTVVYLSLRAKYGKK
jgi:uncharacterized membrane protein